MRELARFDDSPRAHTLGDALYVDGIHNRVDETRDGRFAVWVHDESQLEQARELLQAFENDPDDPRFAGARQEAARLRKEERRREKKDRHRTVRMRDLPSRGGSATLTLGLIIVSVGVSALQLLGQAELVQRWVLFELGFIARGQVWRLITPIFLHFGVLHLLFDMLWLRDLGSMVERRQSTWFLALFVAVIGIGSNFGQYYMTGPGFGGMSGVVYGLLGYIWVRGRLEPMSGYGLPRFIVVWMVGWLVLCFTPLIPHVANTAHTVGLGGGALWGALAARASRMRR